MDFCTDTPSLNWSRGNKLKQAFELKQFFLTQINLDDKAELSYRKIWHLHVIRGKLGKLAIKTNCPFILYSWAV